MVTPVKVKDIDTNQNGKIEDQEWNEWKNKEKPPSTADIKVVDADGVELVKKNYGDVFDQNGNVIPAASNLDVFDQAKTKLQNEMEKLFNDIENFKKNGQEDNAKQLKEQLKTKIEKAIQWSKLAGKALFDVSKYKNIVGMNNASGNFGFKAQTTSPGSSQASGSQSAQQQGASAQVPGSSFQLPGGWGAAKADTPVFNSQAYMSALQNDSNIAASWDAVTANQNRGKQLMMLFLYFAKMAESGDMGAMYQFMKFITYIVSKDKAKQQIEMGKKLIQLQDLSRQWTNKLMNISTDSSNANASNELMKTMTIVKSETDAIATSQKLISQMMEEFSQVVETLTNVTKSAMEAHGRIMRTVSQMR